MYQSAEVNGNSDGCGDGVDLRKKTLACMLGVIFTKVCVTRNPYDLICIKLKAHF